MRVDSLAGSCTRSLLFEGIPEHGWEVAAFNPNVLYDPELDSYLMVYRGTTNDGHDFRPRRYMSSIGLATSRDGVHFERLPEPIITPTEAYEDAMGCEDPVLHKQDGQFVVTYDAVGGDGPKVRMAVATSDDLQTWIKHGTIGPDRTAKSAVLFPEAVNGDLIVLYTLAADSSGSSIWAVRFPSLEELMQSPPEYWEKALRDEANLVLGPSTSSVFKGPETAAPPIRTSAGWLLVVSPETANPEGEWTISALLLDVENPTRVVGALPEPIVRPSEPRDNGPVCHNCVFPRGGVVVGHDLYIYHGTGDNGCALSVCPLDRILSAFQNPGL